MQYRDSKPFSTIIIQFVSYNSATSTSDGILYVALPFLFIFSSNYLIYFYLMNRLDNVDSLDKNIWDSWN